MGMGMVDMVWYVPSSQVTAGGRTDRDGRQTSIFFPPLPFPSPSPSLSSSQSGTSSNRNPICVVDGGGGGGRSKPIHAQLLRASGFGQTLVNPEVVLGKG